MKNHSHHDRPELSAPRLSKWARLQALLFTGTIGTTLLTLGLLAETKLPRQQSE